MLDLRARLILGAIPAGFLIGTAAWLLAGGRSNASAQISTLTMSAAAPAGRTRALDPAPANDLAQAINAPLFALTTGPGAVSDVAVRLEGLARSPGRAAALIAIDGQASAWLALGQSRDGVTLQEVSSGKILVDTPTGPKEIALGSTGAVSAAAGVAPPTAIDPARGFRMPPQPASAPAMGGR